MVSRPVAAGAAVAIVAAAGLYLLWPKSAGLIEGTHIDPTPTITADVAATAAGGGTSGNGSASGAVPTISAQESLTALCQVRTAAVTSLLGGASGSGRFEALRDAIPALDERITEVQSAANGRPQVKPVLTAVRGVYSDWTTALNTYDSGKNGSAALRRAGTTIESLDGTVKKALGPSARC